MRKPLLLLALTGLPLAVVQAVETYNVDTAHTYGHFGISHLGFSTMYGRIHSTGGSFTLDRDNMTGSVEVTLDPASVDTGHQDRDDHLRSPDFLNVVEYPEMHYESTSVTLTEDGGTIEGNLTLHGQTLPVELTITAWHCGANPLSNRQTCGFDATAEIMRSDFGMNYGLPAIGDEMSLMIGIEGILAE